MSADTYTMGLPDAPVRCHYCGEVIDDRRQRCPELAEGYVCEPDRERTPASEEGVSG